MVATRQIMIELCKETGEPGGANNQTIFGCILDAIRDLAIFNMPSWQTKDGLTLNKYNALDWPSGCVKPLITYVKRNGRAFALDVSDDITTTANDAGVDSFTGADTQLQDFFRIDGGYAQYPFQVYNWGLGELYGWGSGYNKIGVVTHDKNRRQSFVKGITLLTGDTFGFFFKSDGLTGCPTVIPSECKEPIELFALYKYYRTRNPNLGDRFLEKYTQFCYRLSKFESDEGILPWIDAFNTNVVSSPKL